MANIVLLSFMVHLLHPFICFPPLILVYKSKSDLSRDKDGYKGVYTNEPRHDKIKKNECAPSEDSDQPGHPPSLIRVFAVRSVGS